MNSIDSLFARKYFKVEKYVYILWFRREEKNQFHVNSEVENKGEP